MQAIMTNDTPQDVAMPQQGLPHIRIETIAIIFVVLLAVVLRLAELDTVAMSENEANQALSAWMLVSPSAPAFDVAPSSSPLTFWGQVFGLSAFQRGELGARLFSLVVGIGLVLSPLLFRAQIGMVSAFLWVLMLAISPVAMGASRTSDPSQWVALSSLLLLWASWQYWQSRSGYHAILIAVGGAGLLFLSGGSGLIFALILVGAFYASLWWTSLNAPQDFDVPAEDVLQQVGSTLRGYPYALGFGVMVGAVMLVATGFMLYPAGLGMVGQGLSEAITRIWQPYSPTIPPLYPLIVLFIYEGTFVVLALAGYMFLANNGKNTLQDRFALTVGIMSAFVLLFYRGASPAYALWILLPVGWLVARAVNELLNDRTFLFYWDLVGEGDSVTTERFGWVKWLLGTLFLTLLVAISFHLQAVGRGLVTIPPTTVLGDAISRAFTEPALWSFRLSFVWVLLLSLFTVVGALLVASIWGNRITLQGLGVGLFVFALISGLGGGFNAIVTQADKSTQIWHSATVSRDAMLLRQTLLEVAQRDTKGFPDIPVTVLLDETTGLTPNGVTAWILRDFKNARFVPTLADASRDQIVIMPEAMADEVDLGGSYVGQAFTLSDNWSLTSLEAKDWLGWLAQRRANVPVRSLSVVVLWLRIDVYDALPIEQRQQ